MENPQEIYFAIAKYINKKYGKGFMRPIMYDNENFDKKIYFGITEKSINTSGEFQRFEITIKDNGPQEEKKKKKYGLRKRV